jgi:hypothetical protein
VVRRVRGGLVPGPPTFLQHLAFDRERSYPFPSLFVSMLQRLDIEADYFATRTGTMGGLEMA